MEQVETSQQQQQQQQQIVAVDGGNGHTTNDTNEDGFGAIFVNGEYQPKAHFACEKRRVEQDLTIPQIVDELGEEVCDFVYIETKMAGTQTYITYHPNPKAELTEGLEWTAKPALYIRNGGRFYKEASNKKIFWNYNVLKGDIFGLIEKIFNEDFMNGTYNTCREDFSKKVARFIQDHPHENARSYGVYMKYFKDMIQAMDENMTPVALELILMSIGKCLDRVVDFKDRELPERELYLKVIETTTQMTVQQCSKSVHYRISKIDVDSQKAKTDLIELSKNAERQREAERLEKQAKIEEMKARMAKFSTQKALPPQKRKIEDVTDSNNEEDHPAKIQKTDD